MKVKIQRSVKRIKKNTQEIRSLECFYIFNYFLFFIVQKPHQVQESQGQVRHHLQ